jgi:hypothetical protein
MLILLAFSEENKLEKIDIYHIHLHLNRQQNIGYEKKTYSKSIAALYVQPKMCTLEIEKVIRYRSNYCHPKLSLKT